MTRYLPFLLIALAAPAHAWPNSGATLTLTVPPGKHLADVSPDPLVHPLWALCGGPAQARSEKQADGSVVWNVRCR